MRKGISGRGERKTFLRVWILCWHLNDEMKPSKDKREVIRAEVRVIVRALSWETERYPWTERRTAWLLTGRREDGRRVGRRGQNMLDLVDCFINFDFILTKMGLKPLESFKQGSDKIWFKLFKISLANLCRMSNLSQKRKQCECCCNNLGEWCLWLGLWLGTRRLRELILGKWFAYRSNRAR